jgi:hypothetical protein
MVALLLRLSGMSMAFAIGASRPPRTEQFEDVVERRGVGAAGLHHRLDVVEVRVEQRVGEPRLVALHPVGVARDRVDLAVVGQHPEGLRQLPGREGVGGVALVVDGEAADEAPSSRSG